MLSAQEHAQACSRLVDTINEGNLRHIGQAELSGAIRAAATRPLGDAWAWSRKHSSANISPLVSVTLALSAAMTAAPKKAVFAWPNDRSRYCLGGRPLRGRRVHHARVRDEGPPANFRIALVMSDRDVVERFAEIFGGNVTRQKPPRYKPNWNETWAWMATGDRARGRPRGSPSPAWRTSPRESLGEDGGVRRLSRRSHTREPVRDAASCSVPSTPRCPLGRCSVRRTVG